MIVMKLRKYKKDIEELQEKTKDMPESRKYEIAKEMLAKLEELPETKISKLAKKNLLKYIEEYEKKYGGNEK